MNGTNGIYSGDKSGTNIDLSAIKWFRLELGTNGAALTLSDYGRIFDAVHPTNAWWYHYPSLAVNCPGDTVAGFSGSSATNYIGAYYTVRVSSGSILDQPRLIRAGTTNFTDGGWGDYSATTLDPADGWSFWTVQEYATSAGPFNTRGWSTVVARIRPNPDGIGVTSFV